MTLIENWRAEFNRVWSVKLSVASVFCGLVDLCNQVLPFLTDFVPSRAFAIASISLALASAVARVVKQNDPTPAS